MSQEPESRAVSALAGRRVLVGVTGSIAAFKAIALCRLLQQAGAEIQVILTPAALEFVGQASFRGFGIPTHTELWEAGDELHVRLANWADLLVIAPATADTMSRACNGSAGQLLDCTLLCFDGPVFFCPAMHPHMWKAKATQKNARSLVELGFRLIGPMDGPVASGDSGTGRMAEPDQIIEELEMGNQAPGELAGKHVVVTAGPTRELLDPVRALTNISSGKMGYAIARDAARRGARVTLISGPTALACPSGVQRINVESALEMQAALDQALGKDLSGADALVMAAAVSDYRPRSVSPQKLKRDQARTLALEPNPDLLASLGRQRRASRPVLVGFALETASEERIIGLARQKLIDKRVDLVVANHAADALGKDENRVLLVTPSDCVPIPPSSKAVVARHLVDWLSQRLHSEEGERS